MPAVSQAVHVAAVQKARDTLSQDEATIERQLQAEADTLTETLWITLAPHFHKLSELARGFRQSSGQPEEDLHASFRQSITTLIKAALHHKLHLLATGSDYNYTWPGHGEDYDEDSMKILGAEERLPLEVRFTVFPGLEVKVPGGSSTIHQSTVRVQFPSMTS